ncbi:TPA: 4'-phosphopantetheinyl transferase superfamily protein [Staphylococcus aureus]
MIYEINEVYTIDSFDPDKILSDLLNGYSSIVFILTDEINLNTSDYIFLTDEQIQYIHKIAVLNDKVNYLISHSIVNIFYCKLMNCSIDELNYYYNPYSKPNIKNNDNVNFSISHTSGCSLIAFSNVNIGVDIENIERKIDFENIIDCYFSASEKKYINSDPIKFFEFWVSKEAYLKCIGYGLVKGIKDANINAINSNGFEIINRETLLKYVIQIELIYSQYVVGVTTSEVKYDNMNW